MTIKWNLSDEQFRTMQVLTGQANGVSKIAAKLLNLESKTVDKRVLLICRKMGAPNRMAAILLFDRTYRAQVEAIKPAHGVSDCQHCAGLGFVQRRAA